MPDKEKKETKNDKNHNWWKRLENRGQSPKHEHINLSEKIKNHNWRKRQRMIDKKKKETKNDKIITDERD